MHNLLAPTKQAFICYMSANIPQLKFTRIKFTSLAISFIVYLFGAHGRSSVLSA